MRKFYKLMLFVFVSMIISSGNITISRTYDVNKNILDVVDKNQGKLVLEGAISFQACDSSACIPVFQDISHLIFDSSFNQNSTHSESILYEDFGFLITENLSLIENDNPFIPDWGDLEIEGFINDSDSTIKYVINFNINSGYHIFTTDTLLSPLGTGNTDIYWENNDLIASENSYTEPIPYVKYNKLYKQQIGYHDGEKHEYVKYQENNTEESNTDSLFNFFLGAFIAGLAAIFTPCVFPMIPLTVSFFTNKGDNKQSNYGPLIYGLSIILIFIILGLGFSFLLGASALNALATSAIANLLFFFIFFIFALSFFGAFEIALPNSLLNKMNKKADQGGIIGIFFMAFTLVLISFSCTAPIVGSVLILSSDGEFLKPIIGMLGFSLSFALVFTLTATFPKSLDNMPKGFNLNSIKVFLGFVELAFSLKFLSKADLTNQWGILNREIYLAIWIVIFMLLGFYLLGKIKLYHDNDNDRIGIIRLFLAIASFSFVVAIFPGMFGAPLSWLSGYLPPPSTQEFDITERFDQIESHKIYQDFPKNVKYQNLKNFKMPLGLKGFYDYDEALKYSQKVDKPLFLDFTGFACENCRLMEHNVWAKPHILEMLKKDFIIVSLFVDSKYKLNEDDWLNNGSKTIKQLGLKNLHLQTEKFNNAAQPLYVIIDKNENILSEPIGYSGENKFYEFLKKGIK
jgi:thiol:disulfide interchange protein